MVSISVGLEISFLPGWHNADTSASAVYLSFPGTLPDFVLLPLASARDRYYFQARRGGDYQRRESGYERGTLWHGGGSGVLQREIPSITPWASYIRDYFSFLSRLFFSPLFLTLSYFFSLSPLSSLATTRFPAGSEVSFKRRRCARGPAGVPLSFLRNCGKLAAWCSALRYVTRRQKWGEKRIVCRRG